MTDRTIMIVEVEEIPLLNDNDTVTYKEYTGIVKQIRELDNNKSSHNRHPTVVYKTEKHFFIYREVSNKKYELEIISHE